MVERVEEIDVVIVGAGLSGIAMAHQLVEDHPGLSYTILEGRERIGGTWDLFRYPGIRSDSAMSTFGYSFRPWAGTEHFGNGEQIREYIEETAAEYGIDRQIRFRHRVNGANWDSGQQRWTLSFTDAEDHPREVRCRFLIGCTGYYRYDRGYAPHFDGEESFEGELFHAQQWPEGLDVEGRKITVIGSGATAITVVPALVDAGAKVTMLQRSPSYVATVPTHTKSVELINRFLSRKRAGWLLRWMGVFREIIFFNLARRFPDFYRRLLITGARKQFPEGMEKRHQNPAYDPWIQRVCFAPDGDFFEAFGSGGARLETGNIERVEADRICLREGPEIETDVIVKATGLDILILGDMQVTVDGEPAPIGEQLVYKGAMLAGVPNLGFIVGYTNASWTLKAELTAAYLSRLLSEMETRRASVVVPVAPDREMETTPVLNIQSGYIKRAENRLPKAGDRSPWVLHHNYLTDLRELRQADFDDGAITFSRAP